MSADTSSLIIEPNAIVNLSSLLNDDASVYEVEASGLLMPDDKLLEADGFRLAEPIEWSLIVRGTGGDDDYILEGEFSGEALMDCRRCLDGVAAEAEGDFIYPMLYKQGKSGLILAEDDNEDDDLLIFGKPEVDFSELITQLFAIELPLTVLCKEDCKGLSSDGVNLNEHPEHEVPKKEEKPSPFAELKNLDL